MNLTRASRTAIRKYGLDACLTAYVMHQRDGEGASTIAFQGPTSLRTTRQADAAINAAREVRTQVLRTYLWAVEYDPSRVSCLPQFAYSTAANDAELRLRAAL